MAHAVLTPAVSTKTRLNFRYPATIFAGAFLLFQIQPIMGKYVLPWFGGTASVWTTCMLFFQLLLLGGYLYSHLISSRLNPRTQASVHMTALALTAVAIVMGALMWKMPLLPSSAWRPDSPEHPVAHLLALLFLGVGLPYLLLSSTGPLLQSWFARDHERQSPYWLYALSNIGSLLGLVSYPVFFEPICGLRSQAWIWVAGYAVFLAGSLVCALKIRKSAPAGMNARRESATADPEPPPSPVSQLFWFLLAALPSVMLLATTNLICQEVAVIPFLWVLPLSLYLITLIVCFENPKWYRRETFQTLLGILLPLAALAFVRTRPMKPVVYLIAVFCATLFACCMVCHGELVRLRPQPAHLTRFYLLVSAGGAAGGFFVAAIAPHLFSGYWEFQAGLVACLVLVLIVLTRDKASWWYWPTPALGLLICLGIALTPDLYIRYLRLLVPPDAFYTFHYYGLLTIFAVGVVLWHSRVRKRPARYRRFNLAQVATAVFVAGVSAALWQQIQLWRHDEVRRDRNFYGSLAIYYHPENQAQVLMHGQTSHGFQFLNDAAKPTSYYGRDGGLGLFLDARPPCSGLCRSRYGLIGMGVGTIASYGRPGEVMRFYEINPRVIDYSMGSRPYFTFIRNSAAHVSAVPGDARLSLERELKEHGSQDFDLLVVDAFNSDSIPVHLLTQEAFQLYLAHLRSENSVLAFHISNRTLDLRPVLVGLATRNHLSYVRVHKDRSFILAELSDWVLMSRNPEALDVPGFAGHIAPMPPPSEAVYWTDDYSNLFRVLKFGEN